MLIDILAFLGARKEGVRFIEPEEGRGGLSLAVTLLNYMLDHQVNQSILMAKNLAGLRDISGSLISILELMDKRSNYQDYINPFHPREPFLAPKLIISFD